MNNEASPAYRCRYTLAVAVAVLVCLKTPIRGQPDKKSLPSSAGVVDARRLASQQMSRNFDPSLEMKENADFLLTPALLLQEAISENVVITYPSE